jgi:voltage-gated potassium channel
MVRALLRDQRVRSVLGLVAVLGLYFAFPVEHQTSPVVLTLNLLISVACMAVVGLVIFREFRRLQLGQDMRFTGGQLVIALEVVLVVFALSYFSLAVYSPGEMDGIQTKIDALYFSATTVSTVGYGDIHAAGQVARVVTTVQLVFDVLFIASFARLLSEARPPRTRRQVDDESSRD